MLVEGVKFRDMKRALFLEETFQDCAIHLLLVQLLLSFKIRLKPLKMRAFIVRIIFL